MRKKLLSILALLCLTISDVWADDFTVERAVNLGQLDSWADMSQFQWQEIDHGVLDNHMEMDALINLFYDPAPKDTVNFYNQIYSARDNQYIVLRLDKAQGKRPFYIRVTSINSSEDSSLNTSKLFTAVNYAYIMPPIGETQFMVKIWPQGEGEEMAKTYTFHGHSYGTLSLRSAMLDKSRIVPGDYDLQLIFYNSDTEKSDTTYIESLQTDKLYTFYDYKDGGDLVESYLRVNRSKRIKLKPESWAKDVVTHINDNSVTVMTGPKMPFNQHKRLDAPNPTYLDSRLFSHHDTLWVNLYLDNALKNEAEGLTMHAVLADFDNNPVGDKLLTWGLDPVSQRLYVLTDGEPCTIECYRDGFLPKLYMYPGSYDHVTGIISGDREEADIFLESIDAPVNSPRVTAAVLSTLTPSTDRRGDAYVSEIQQADILPTLLTETVKYDEFASHQDTAKIVNGERLMSYTELEVAIVSPADMGSANITLKKVNTTTTCTITDTGPPRSTCVDICLLTNLVAPPWPSPAPKCASCPFSKISISTFNRWKRISRIPCMTVRTPRRVQTKLIDGYQMCCPVVPLLSTPEFRRIFRPTITVSGWMWISLRLRKFPCQVLSVQASSTMLSRERAIRILR